MGIKENVLRGTLSSQMLQLVYTFKGKMGMKNDRGISRKASREI